MEGKDMVARICAILLSVSLIAIDVLPAFAATGPEGPAADKMHTMEENVTDKEQVSTEDIEENSEGAEEPEPEPELPNRLEEEPELPNRLKEEAELPHTAESEIFDGTEPRPEMFSVPEPKEGQETVSGIQENSDGLLYLDGAPYNGYYMDSDGILYSVTNGMAEPKTGTVDAGTEYYDCSGNGYMALPVQTLFVEGKTYTGYYMDSQKKMYYAKKGACTMKTGTVKAGAKYYSCNAKKILQLPKQTLYVKGKVYTGYYMNKGKKMYRVKKGTRTLFTGTVKAGAKYYSYNAKKTLQLSKQTLYVKGKVYTGYYMNKGKKMYRVKKGTRTLVTGMLDAGAKYYSYHAKRTLQLSKQTLYVRGKIYSGYYMDHEAKMNSVSKGTCTLVNTGLNAGTKYYSYHAKKTLALPELTVYVNGKAMEGMSPESLATLQRAQAVVASITNDSMAKEEKLRACFEFVKTYKGGWPRTPHYTGMDWPVVYANDMFVNDGKGNCFSYAAAFAYMAKAIGYEEVYACNGGGHGWAEVDGLIFDPERNKFDPSFSYYAVSYDTKTKVDYKGSIAAGLPWMHVKI